MKTSSSKRLTFYISIILSLISILFTILNVYSNNLLLTLSVSIPIFFIIVYYLVHYLLNHYIYDKIKPIYKTIQDFNVSKDKLKKEEKNRDIISKVNKDVSDWTRQKAKEIEKLKELGNYRKEFLGNVSHELKTPIFNIQGYILTLLEGGLEDPNVNRLYLKRTAKSIDRMISIVEDLETISKLESGKLKLNYEKFDIIKLVEDVFDIHQRLAKESSIDLKFITDIEKPIIVNADRKRIFQVLSNLVENALKYGRKNGKVTAGFFDMNKNILVEIADNGYGIDKKDLPRIFERFYRIDKSRSREQGGTGLGLSIVKHIIEAHKQTINVKSTVNEGTSFTFTLEKGNK